MTFRSPTPSPKYHRVVAVYMHVYRSYQALYCIHTLLVNQLLSYVQSSSTKDTTIQCYCQARFAFWKKSSTNAPLQEMLVRRNINQNSVENLHLNTRG